MFSHTFGGAGNETIETELTKNVYKLVQLFDHMLMRDESCEWMTQYVRVFFFHVPFLCVGIRFLRPHDYVLRVIGGLCRTLRAAWSILIDGVFKRLEER